MRGPRILPVLMVAVLSACWQVEPVPEPLPEPPPVREVPARLKIALPTGITPGESSQAAAVEYAWQLFVSVNWPALAGQRGVADTSKVIGQPGEVVWETWKDPSEVFLPDGSKPVPWDQYGGAVPPQCEGAAATDFVLTRISKSPHDSDSPVFERQRQAVGGTLTDQRGNLVRYEIRMNQVIFTDILDGTLYNVQGQDAAGPIDFDDASMEAKASWRLFTAADTPEIRARYYSREAWVYTPPSESGPATCVQQAVGLVGLHVTQKTAAQPQWTWATFEQVDNVPPWQSEAPPPPGLIYALNDPACPVQQCPPNTSTEVDGKPTGVPTQVTRMVNVGGDAAAANPQWQADLAQAWAGSPWAYYELVDIQWPQNPTFDAFGDPTPLLLANTTMETYVPQSSCLGCHYTANTASNKKPSDFSFMLAEAFPATAAGAQP